MMTPHEFYLETTKHERREPGHIYFVRCTVSGLIKIGYTDGKPVTRLSSLTVGSPVRLESIALIRGHTADEVALHARFTESWSHGEWFRPDRRLLDFIAESGTPWDEEPIPVRRPGIRKPPVVPKPPADPERSNRARRIRLINHELGLYEESMETDHTTIEAIEYREAALAYSRAMDEVEAWEAEAVEATVCA